MAVDLRRITISVTPALDADLKKAKQEYYFEKTKNDMMKDLIVRGLSALKEDGNPGRFWSQDMQLHRRA